MPNLFVHYQFIGLVLENVSVQLDKIEGTISNKKIGKPKDLDMIQFLFHADQKITFGQMRPEKKHKIDHRYKAFKKIKKFL